MKILITSFIILLSSGPLSAQAGARLAALPERVNRAKPDRAGQIDYDIFEHEAVLANGTIPLKFLPELVRGQLMHLDTPRP
jgi:hypothetical protein